MASHNPANEPNRKLTILVVSTLFYLSSPILLASFLILWFYRYFLSLWKKIWHPRFGPLLGSIDSIFANESPYTKDQLTNIDYYVTVQGRIDLEDFRSVVQKGLDRLELNETEHEKSRNNRKLRQVLRKWGGYYIGEDERNFKVEDHVRLLNVHEINQRLEEQCEPKIRKVHLDQKIHEESLTEDEVSQITQSLLRIPYKTQTSPWEILLLYNPNPEAKPEPDGESKSKAGISKLGTTRKWTTVVILRIHHSLGDGIALTCLFSHFLDQSPEYSVGRILNNFSHNTGRSMVGNFCSVVKKTTDFVLGVPDFVSYWLTCCDQSWPPVTADMKQPRDNYSFTFEFSKEKVWKIQNSCGSERVTSSTVLMTTAAMSFSEFFKKYSNKVDGTLSGSILPQSTFITASQGDPRGRNELTNGLTFIGIKVPFASVQAEPNYKKILCEVDKRYLFAKNSGACQVEKVCTYLYGLVPVRLRPPIFVTTKAFAMSYVPCFEKPVTILGKPVISVRAATAAPELSYICMVFFVTHDKFHGYLQIAKKFIDSRADAQTLAKTFEKKFDDMYQDLTQRDKVQTK